MKDLTLREIQMTELQILLDFQQVCEKYHLKFYLCGGTLLGAVRHKGFIPWDDDIDVMMPRTDYDKLMKLEKEQGIFNKHLKLYSFEMKNADYPFAKVVNMNTTILQQYAEDESLSHIWIDIFPADGLPKDNDEAERIYKKVGRYRKALTLCWAKVGEGTTKLKRYAKYLFVPMAKTVGAHYWCKQIVQMSRQYGYEEAEYAGVISWGLHGLGERCLKEKFEKSVEVEFEGYKFPAMSCWKEYLTGLYGDYMQLPPEEEREVHMMKAWLNEE